MSVMRQPLNGLLNAASPESLIHSECARSLLLGADGRVALRECAAARILQGTVVAMNDQRRLIWRATGAPLPLATYLNRLRFRSSRPLLSLIHQSGVGTLVVHFSTVAQDGGAAVRLRFAGSGAASAVQEHLRRAFKLTPTELEVAGGLAGGIGVGDLAMQRGCSVNTVRTHAASILSKMGINRQSELICVIAQLNQLLSSP